MNHPFERITTKKQTLLFLILLTVTALLLTVMNVTGAPLETAAAPSGIISYELAGTVEQASAILNSWDSYARISAAFSLGIDYLFMVAYSTLFSLACVMAAQVFLHRNGGFITILGIMLAWGQWIAAVFDAVENLSLTIMLFNEPSGLWPQLAYTMAVMKFTLILIGLAYAAAAGFIRLMTKARPRYQRAG